MRNILFCLALLLSTLAGPRADASASPPSSSNAAASDSQAAHRKKIFFIGTGGTIAGIAANPGSPLYDPGKVTIDAILAAVPDIKNLADISGQQLIDQLRLEQLIASGLTEAEALKKPEAY